MSESQSFDFNELAEAWGAPIVARTDVGKFSGGLLHPRTLANLDSLGKGPGKIKVGGRVCYETSKLTQWMMNR
jgi:hypothetical protein